MKSEEFVVFAMRMGWFLLQKKFARACTYDFFFVLLCVIFRNVLILGR